VLETSALIPSIEEDRHGGHGRKFVASERRYTIINGGGVWLTPKGGRDWEVIIWLDDAGICFQLNPRHGPRLATKALKDLEPGQLATYYLHDDLPWNWFGVARIEYVDPEAYTIVLHLDNGVQIVGSGPPPLPKSHQT